MKKLSRRDLQLAGGEVGQPGNGKVPTVTSILLGNKISVGTPHEWVSRLHSSHQGRLKVAAELAMTAGAGIITIETAAGGWRLGLRKRESGNSGCHKILLPSQGDLNVLRDGLKAIGCETKGLGFSGKGIAPVRTAATDRAAVASVAGPAPVGAG